MKYHALFKWAFMIAGALALWVANAAPATAQQRGTLRGTVREASSQRPVAGVQVFVPGTQMSTTTDAQGRFELAGVPAGGAQVRVRAPGYSSALATTMVVGGQAVTVDFALNTSVIALDEVVVTGTGAAAERKQLGNTIATVRADVIETAPVKSFSEAIAAREPGVSLLPSSGMAGEGARVRIRGNASLSMNNEPVVYVDGVRIDAGSVGFQPTGQVSMLDNINPETIERVEILKGAAAATLYGSEASAGVIQIFTKKGTQGRPRFSFRIDQGGSRFPADRMKDNWGFARNQAQADRLNAIHRGTAVDANGNPVATIQPFQVVGFPNVSSKSTWATGYDASYSATVAGGGADAVYNLAVRFTRDNGPFDVSEVVGPFFIDQLPFEPGKIDFNRKWHGSGNVTLFPKDRVTLSAGFFFTDVQHQTPANANNIYGVTGATLFAKPETGNCARSIDRGLGGAFGEDPDRPGHCAGPGNPWGNVAFATVRENAFSEDQAHVDHFNANLRAGYTPVQGRLSMDLTLGVDITNSREHQFVPWGNNVDVFSTRVPLGHKSLQSRFNRELSVDYKANWTKSFGIFSSQLTVGGQGFISKAHFRSGFGGDFPGPGLEVAGAGARQSTGEFFSEIVNLGLMGQEQVGINEWWFITLGGRWDRNSAFGENTTGQLYPKVSTSIVVSDLPNWTSTTLSTLRFRGALGRSGLQPGAFDRFTTFGPSTSQLGAGLSPRNLGNPDLKPEVTTEWEAGVEVGLVDNRVALDVTRWERTTIDALVSRQFAVTGGFLAPQLSNIGELEAKGWDLKLNALVYDRPGFSVNLFANGAYLFQRIVDMGGAPPIKVGGAYPRYRNWLWEGQAPGVLLGALVIQPCGQTQHTKCLGPGQVPFDTNRDGVPDTRAELEAYLSVPRSIDLFNSPSGIGPLLDDNNGDGDFLNNCMGPMFSPNKGNTKILKDKDGNDYEYCLTKATPDWTGAFGAEFTIRRNVQINALFEYRAGNFFVSNLTDAFRNTNPLIGRNNQRPAELEATLLNPASTPAERADAALEYATLYKELTPYDGMNLAEKADFIRWREVGITYTAPASFAQKLGFSNMAFTLSARNLALFTGYTGIDPEMNAVSSRGGGLSGNFLDGVEAFSSPIPRRVALSARFGF